LSIERIQPIERESLSGGETLPCTSVGSVMEHHAVLEREPAPILEGLWSVECEQTQAQLDVAEQLALVAARDL
jgi:hypothetical protein